MSDLISELAEKLSEATLQGDELAEDCYARVLREAGLERLIRAGKLMREGPINGGSAAWDAALAAFREAVKR